VDDLGYGDLGCFGQEKILTPNIDKLAEEGMKFTRAYAGNAVCAPSRSCLMEGKHPGHARVRGNMIRGYRESLRKGDFTVAMMLQEAGYKTGLFGKWGLGLHNQYGVPNRMGFDEFFGYLNQRHAHCHYPEFLYHNDQRVYYPENGMHHKRENYQGEQVYDEKGNCHPLGIEDPSKAKYAFDEYCKKSLEFVRRNRDQPFFLYLAYTPPHGSFIVPELGVYNRKDWALSHKVYAAMITRVDKEVGKLIRLLEELEMDDNTLILFASDNGNMDGNAREEEITTPVYFDNVSPTRGGKGSSYDGGFHVPAIAWWKTHISPGQVSDHIWAFWDFLPTAAELAGVDAPANIDGISFLPVLLGDTENQQERDFLYWEFKGIQSVRMDNWFGYKPGGELELFNLASDPGQDEDVSGRHPEIAGKIREIMAREHSPSDVWPSPGETTEAFNLRMEQLGITREDRPENVADF
jgi:arylsulfatase A-like enzyme